MKKLVLNFNDLQVESFDTTPASEEQGDGTVFGLTAGGDTTGPGVICTCTTEGQECLCGIGDTCGLTCGTTCTTCSASCGGTCNTCGSSCGGTCNTCGTACGTLNLTCGTACPFQTNAQVSCI